MITGGTGSFGHQMANILCRVNPKEVKIFSRHEDLQHSMAREFPNFVFVLGDVRDYERVLEATKNIDIIFHAAALKQISDIERHPMEAVKTNILGT